MHIQDLLNVIRREAERVVDRRSFTAVGTITGYDPATHSAKVALQPEGNLTGWLPILSLSVGNAFGISVGPSTGVSCLVHFHEGDRESGVIAGMFFTETETPPSVQSGEVIIKTSFGSSIALLQDGSAAMTDKGGGSVALDGTGALNITLASGKVATVNGANGAKIVIDSSGDITLTPGSGSKVLLGGSAGAKPIARHGDLVVAGAIVATTLISSSQ